MKTVVYPKACCIQVFGWTQVLYTLEIRLCKVKTRCSYKSKKNLTLMIILLPASRRIVLVQYLNKLDVNVHSLKCGCSQHSVDSKF